MNNKRRKRTKNIPEYVDKLISSRRYLRNNREYLEEYYLENIEFFQDMLERIRKHYIDKIDLIDKIKRELL